MLVESGAVTDGGALVASATGSVAGFVLALATGAFVPEGATAGAVKGAIGIGPGPLSCFVNAVPARR